MSQRRDWAIVLAAAVAMCWPAMLNGYPLLYPDSVTYVSYGRLVARALWHGQRIAPVWVRSPYYSLGIAPMHGGWSAWPVVGLHALIVAYVLWLTVRSVERRRAVWAYAGVIGVLSLCTGLSWSVSFVMPDVLGAVVYLALWLIVFARETLSTRERIVISGLAVWGALAHVTHLLVGWSMCVPLGVMLLWPRLRSRQLGVLWAVSLLSVATVAQLGMARMLTGKVALQVNRPPVLMARMLADGPARAYLQQRCPGLGWVLCRYTRSLPTTEDDFLWPENGIWMRSSPEERQQLLAEEMPLLREVLRSEPGAQVRVSGKNFWTQFMYFDLDDFGNSAAVSDRIGGVLPGAAERYARTLQSRNQVPSDAFSDLQRWVVGVSLGVVGLLAVVAWKRLGVPMVGLTVAVGWVLVVNAGLTGVLSGIDARYQARVVWLLPLLAMLYLLRLGPGWKASRAQRRRPALNGVGSAAT